VEGRKRQLTGRSSRRPQGIVRVKEPTYNDGGVPTLRLLVFVELSRADGALASLWFE
jgi:hypothetical protein